MTSSVRRKLTGSYAALLLMLLTWMLVLPAFAPADLRRSFIGEAAMIALLLTSIGTAAGRPREMRALGAFALAVVAAGLLVRLVEDAPVGAYVAVDALRVVFLCLVSLTILRHVLGSDSVSRDTILGAVCVYLLIGSVFAVAYRMVAAVDPHAIEHMGDSHTYFSLVTLTTLGYGDVVPISSTARSLAAGEAVLGQLYIAVVLAWLVGLHMSERRRGRQ